MTDQETPQTDENEVANTEPKEEKRYMRKVRSFVKREGRMTNRQQTATDTLWATMGITYSNEMIDFAAVFGNDNPVVLEVGFGMGKSLIEMALNAPEKNFVGIEVHGPGVGACLADAGDAGVTNLRVLNHDAVEVLEFMIPEKSLSTFQLYFPDPWHKARHNKRRIVNETFIENMRHKLVIGGLVHMATDWEPYAVHMLEVMNDATNFKNTAETDYAPRPDWRPLTKFENRGQRLGHGVWDLLFTRTC
ncbi:tRNA (guanosine(46)-N7)-methyltransferase TrmB [Psychromonas sp. Urea-02u-13]|uniref:tRNA (guanosine(46)-N7)-methyltransferase TrmB n=1 Tax=Psychromonas sp. Urea-02u-13 TaxID=2058326 RepID=UPI000C335CE9|nr:tRNA (guanosine(46)-N7)-methyltransferase TrmB [Psychromonas sp. Urea-02u-13]PKG40833.1 tRNA (guanosine(46)-N7)-methyltransferase TrmB [Psychromonas sp. Urea-02u-13]